MGSIHTCPQHANNTAIIIHCYHHALCCALLSTCTVLCTLINLQCDMHFSSSCTVLCTLITMHCVVRCYHRALCTAVIMHCYHRALHCVLISPCNVLCTAITPHCVGQCCREAIRAANQKETNSDRRRSHRNYMGLPMPQWCTVPLVVPAGTVPPGITTSALAGQSTSRPERMQGPA